MRTAPLNVKLAQLKRYVLPIASYRMSRWPYQVHTTKRIDRTQTRWWGSWLAPACRQERSQKISSSGEIVLHQSQPGGMATGAASGQNRWPIGTITCIVIAISIAGLQRLCTIMTQRGYRTRGGFMLLVSIAACLLDELAPEHFLALCTKDGTMVSMLLPCPLSDQ